MKNALFAVVAGLAVLMAAPVMAEDAQVSEATLSSLGLGGFERMSDAEGMTVRGRLDGQGMVVGTSLLSFQLVTPDTKNFINGSSINMVSGSAQFNLAGEQINKAHGVAINPAITLSVAVTNAAIGNYNYSGSVMGQVGGAGGIVLGPLGP